MRIIPAWFLVSWDTLANGKNLINVTAGPTDEIIALAVERSPWTPDFAEPPYIFHITWWHGGTTRSYTFVDVMQPITHVQTYGGDHFLLAARGAPRGTVTNTLIVSKDGGARRGLALSSGIEDVQVDVAGNVWVGNSDQASFSRPDLDHEGLVCFDSSFEPTFRFNTYANSHGLPPMYDCDSLNTSPNGAVYAYYNSSGSHGYRPLVRIQNDNITDMWQIVTGRTTNGLGTDGAHGFAINSRNALFVGSYRQPNRIVIWNLLAGTSEEVFAVGPDGKAIDITDQPAHRMSSRRAWGRGDHLFLLDRRGVWDVIVPTE